MDVFVVVATERDTLASDDPPPDSPLQTHHWGPTGPSYTPLALPTVALVQPSTAVGEFRQKVEAVLVRGSDLGVEVLRRG